MDYAVIFVKQYPTTVVFWMTKHRLKLSPHGEVDVKWI